MFRWLKHEKSKVAGLEILPRLKPRAAVRHIGPDRRTLRCCAEVFWRV